MSPAALRHVVGLSFGLLLLASTPAGAFHGVGIPHYSYDARDPHTPVLTYGVDAGPYEVTTTAYPGILRPRERCSLHVSIRDRETRAAFHGAVRLTVTEDGIIGMDSVVHEPIVGQPEEDGYGFEPWFPSEGNYVARIEFEAEAAQWRIDLPMVVGEPGSPWAVVVATVAGMAVVLVVVTVARTRFRRAPGPKAVTAS
jgi:hypothetical protein